jgi:hypothetical protein
MKKTITIWAIVAVILLASITPTIIKHFCLTPSNEVVASEPEPTEEELICTGEWFVTDKKPSQFTDETYPPRTEPVVQETESEEIIEETEAIEKVTEPVVVHTEPPTEATEPPTEPLIEPPTEPQPAYPEPKEIEWYNDFRTWTVEETITTTVGGFEFDKEFLAKLLHEEAGSMGWTGQVYVCSAILNFCDVECVSLWRAGHNSNMFSVASYVDYARPDQMQYDVIDYVINGGRVYGVTYFRTRHYHNFGTPTCRVENVYFSH